MLLLLPPATLAQTLLSASATGHITAEVITTSPPLKLQMNFEIFSWTGEEVVCPKIPSPCWAVYGRAATHNAASFYVTGEQANYLCHNLYHLRRMK
jgi:hypothetical protein